MPSQQIVVGNIGRGLTSNPLAFNIDNDAFPKLENAYQWRGRIKRKRGTSFLGRLTRYFNSSSTSYSSITTITFDSSGNANLLTGFSLQSNGNIVPGSVTIVGAVGPVTYKDPTMDGFLTPTGIGGPNTINYATGDIHIPAQASGTATVTFNYTPDLPVMGLEDLVLNANQFPGTLAFDTTYSYNISTSFPYSIYDVSFYKNPPVDSVNLPSYVPKTTVTPTSWNGQDYQQFWTTNYQNALWATNGINVPFSTTNVGMQYASTSTITYVSNTATTIVVMITNCPLVIGDFVFLNEWTGANAATLNYQSGYVTASSPNTPALATKTLTITLPFATLGAGPYTPGIIQYLTNRSDITKDCLRWYDGDPTDGNALAPTLNGNFGWVNFAPPLSNKPFSIDDEPELQYYLVGARMIVPYKDRLLFIGPVIQTSSPGSQVYLQDAIIYSQNGTPYYTSSFTGSVTSAITIFDPILIPVRQTSTANAYFEDVTGLGGSISAGYSQPILTAGFNEDVLILGFSNRQTRVVYSGDDIIPFNFFTINSELGSSSTFSGVTLDRGVLSIGQRGIIETSQISSQRIDIQIPDQIFQFNLLSNGVQRVTAQRDFINEWIYFTYKSNQSFALFPNQTLQYNYRDATWAIFNESYTTYGQFSRISGLIWSNVSLYYPTWNSWTDPWNAGTSNLMQPEVIAGNQQGFVVFRDEGTNESNSLYITSISGNTVTSPNHGLDNNDFIIISGALGLNGINNRIFQVQVFTNPNTFNIYPSLAITGTYAGGGLIKRLYIPEIKTRQFPVAWSMARKTRLGPQQYLLTRTDVGQIELQIFLSQNEDEQYNFGPIVPDDDSINDSLVYSDILFTCPESTNLGLTSTNINLNMVTAGQQDQIWHRMNTSLLGDTIQIGFSVSDDQMKIYSPVSDVVPITAATQANPCVLTCNNSLTTNTLILINGIEGMTQLNGNVFNVITASSTTISIDVDSTGFGAYVSGGIITPVAPLIQFSEIELHTFILNVSPSQVLA